MSKRRKYISDKEFENLTNLYQKYINNFAKNVSAFIEK